LPVWTVPATVVRVVDGDTVIVNLDLGWRVYRNEERIRVNVKPFLYAERVARMRARRRTRRGRQSADRAGSPDAPARG
jgi:hypothetical protein